MCVSGDSPTLNGFATSNGGSWNSEQISGKVLNKTKQDLQFSLQTFQCKLRLWKNNFVFLGKADFINKFFSDWVSRGTLESRLGCGAILQGLKCPSLWHGLHPVNTRGAPPPQLGQLKASTGGSAGKESIQAGRPQLESCIWEIPWRWIDYPLQYSWASLVAQLVKKPPTMRKTWVRSLGWEDPLEKGIATHSSILAWRIPWTL